MNRKTTFFGLILTITISISSTFAQEDKSDLARVKKVNGTEAYIMSEPLGDYEVIFDLGSIIDIGTNVKAKSILTGGIVTENINDKVNQFVARAIQKANNNFHDIDAVIYSNAKTAVAIKFKQEPGPDEKGIARVSKINGKRLFIFSEPIINYDVLNEKKGKAQRGTSYLTWGFVNSSIEEDVQKLVGNLTKDARRKGHQLDGVLYSTGKSGVGIKFRE